MASPSTRWGIACTGKIATDFCTVLRLLAAPDNQIAAVAARNLEDARTFAAKHGASRAYGSYEELATDPDVDIVYIAAVHSKHCELTCMMLEAGKHVLCEKPLGISPDEVRKMTGTAREKGLLLVEGFWSRFFPAYEKLRTELASKSIGDVRFVTMSFGFPIERESARHSSRELGGGITMDFGCYLTQLASVIFSNERPETVASHGDMYSTGVDRSTCTTLCYRGGRMVQMIASGECTLNNTAVVYGTRGTITLPLLWAPSEIHSPSGSFSWPLPAIDEQLNFKRCEGLLYEITAVRKALVNGETQVAEMTHDDSLFIAEIQEEILRQIGIVFK